MKLNCVFRVQVSIERARSVKLRETLEYRGNLREASGVFTTFRVSSDHVIIEY